MSDTSTSTKRSARHAWSTGRYPTLAPKLLPVIARLVKATSVENGDRVLDLGCGTGNVALSARRVGGDVVGVDLSRNMLSLAHDHLRVADVEDVDWIEADVEALPFRGGLFDVVLSNFGVVFAPDVDRARDELFATLRPGGRFGLSAWSPDGLVGRLSEVVHGHIEPVSDPRGHLQWGDPEFVREHLDAAESLTVSRRVVPFYYPSPAHFWREFAKESGALAPTLARLQDEAAVTELRADAIDTIDEWFADNAINVDYLEVTGVAPV